MDESRTKADWMRDRIASTSHSLLRWRTLAASIPLEVASGRER